MELVLNPGTGSRLDRNKYPFMAETGAVGEDGHRVRYYTISEAIIYLSNQDRELSERIDEMERMVPFI